MTLGIITVIISFILDSFVSQYIFPSITNFNIFIPMFSLISLIIVFPYFNSNNKDYLITCLITGLIYDITYTNTLGLNMALFLLSGYIIIFLDNGLSNNLFSLLIKMLIIIFIYDSLTYLILILLNYIDYSIIDLFIKMLKSLTLNSIYLIFTYLITNMIAKHFKIRKTK